MKLDALFNSSQQNEDVLEASEEKFDRETAKRSKSIVLFDIREKNLDSSRTVIEDHDGFWQVSEFGSSDFVDSDAAESNTMEVKDFEALNCQSHEDLRIIREKMDHLSDKSANELEVPELVICYKENSYFDIKDICVDENMLSETDVEKEYLRTLLLLERDRSSNLMTETPEAGDPLAEYPVNCEGQDRESAVNQAASEDIKRTKVNVYELAEDVSTGTLPKDQEAVTMLNHQEQSSEDSRNEDTEMFTKEPGPEPILSAPAITPADEERASFTNVEESNSSSLPNHEETISKSPADESNNSCDGKDISDNGNRENQVQNCIPKVPDSRASSFRDQHSHGEASFSLAGAVSGHIMDSGPIAYSGSLSLRSDSSTTSNRSFAFPILQSEWHSSPVRMAKADRRHFRKHKGWKQGLLCCRF